MADYTLQAGDTVQLSVASLPALNVKAMVDIDGRIHLPLLEPIQAAGSTLDDVLMRLRQDLPRKPFRQLAPDGRDTFVNVDPNEITLEIAAYRPVYIRGDVDKPGEIAFRPGLTVRQAIALAGGYDTMHFRMENPFLQSSDLRAQNQSLWIEYARNQAHGLLLEAQINGKDVSDLASRLQAPLPGALLDSIAKIETQRAAAEVADFNRERDYLSRSALTMQSQMDALVKPRDDAQKSELDDATYKKSLNDLLQKGIIAHDRVNDQQRSLLESTQRFLDYSQRISALQKSRDDFNRQVERLNDQHRASLLKELQESNVAMADSRAKLQAVDEKLVYTGAMRSQLTRGSGAKPAISIHHSAAEGGAQDVDGTEDTVLAPGDVVEVALRSVVPAGEASQ